MLDSKDWLELALKCKEVLNSKSKDEMELSYKVGYAQGFIDGLIKYLEGCCNE